MRSVRQRAAVWKQYQPRSQRHQAALERESALGARNCAGIPSTGARLRFVPQEREGTKGLALSVSREPPQVAEAFAFIARRSVAASLHELCCVHSLRSCPFDSHSGTF